MSHSTHQAQTIDGVDARAVAVPFAAIVLAMLPAVLDQTILATALPTIAVDLGRLADVSWVVTAYVVAAAATTPLWGKLGDRHGRKRLLEAALAWFLAASAACGLADSITMLIVARTAQGVAAGGLMSLAMAAVGDLVSPRERARYQGYIAATFAVATVAGPLVGGLLVDQVSWRWVFYVNLPLGLAALAGLRLRLPSPEASRRARAAGRHRRRAARRGHERVHARVHLGRRPLRVGLAGDRGAVHCGPAARRRAGRARAPRGGSGRPLRAAAHPDGRRGQRRVVPGDRRPVRGQRVRPAVPAGHHGRDAHPGRTVARADDDRPHAVDQRRRPRHRSHRPLQGVPGCRAERDDGGARAPRRGRRAPVARRRRRLR